MLTRESERYITDHREFFARFLAPKGDHLFTCSAGVGSGCVNAYGQLQLCMLLRHPETLYDLENGCLHDALTGFFPAVRERYATNPDYLRRCARCFLRGFCEQCPAKSWMEHGTLDTPVDYLCEVAHAQARYLGILKAGEYAWEISDWRDRVEAFIADAALESRLAER